MTPEILKPLSVNIERKDLEFAVDELNEVLFIGCDVKIGKGNDKAMEEELKEAAEEIDNDDSFTARTTDVLRSLGVKAKFRTKIEKKKSTKKKEKKKKVEKKPKPKKPTKTKKKKKVEKKPKPKKPVEKKYTRNDSIFDTLERIDKNGCTLHELIERANTRYSKTVKVETTYSGYLKHAMSASVYILERFNIISKVVYSEQPVKYFLNE